MIEQATGVEVEVHQEHDSRTYLGLDLHSKVRVQQKIVLLFELLHLLGEELLQLHLDEEPLMTMMRYGLWWEQSQLGPPNFSSNHREARVEPHAYASYLSPVPELNFQFLSHPAQRSSPH